MVRFVLQDSAGDLVRETAGAGAIDFPTNGALMNGDQMNALLEYVQREGTPIERGMMMQIKAMVHGTYAYMRTIQQEQDCRHKAENDVRELREAMSRMRTLLNVPMTKIKKAELVDLVQAVMDEMDVFEVAESES